MALSSMNLDAFLAVAQTLNFTKAAELVHLTQSALSQRVLNLEKELETTLFIRDRAGLRLTEAAQELVRYCQVKNALEDECLQKLKSQNSGELAGLVRLGGFSSVLSSVALKALSPLLKKHPKLRLKLFGEELADLLDLLKRGEIDFMISDDRIERDELERIPLGVERNVLVEKKNYRGPDIFLDHDENDTTTIQYLRKAKRSSKSLERYYLDDIHGVLQGVKLGLGRAVVPLHLIKGEKELEVLSPETILEVPVFLYYFAQPYYSNLHHQIVSALKTGFAEL